MEQNGEKEVRRLIIGVMSSDIKQETIDESGAAKHRDDTGSSFI